MVSTMYRYGTRQLLSKLLGMDLGVHPSLRHRLSGDAAWVGLQKEPSCLGNHRATSCSLIIKIIHYKALKIAIFLLKSHFLSELFVFPCKPHQMKPPMSNCPSGNTVLCVRCSRLLTKLSVAIPVHMQEVSGQVPH